MVALLLALLAAQPASPPVSASPPPTGALRCALVTPRGDNVSFSLAGWGDQEEFVDLVAEQGSVWPGRTLPGARNIMQGGGSAARMFAFGSGNGVALKVSDNGGDTRSAVLFRRDRQRPSLPVAFGFCSHVDVTMIYAPVNEQANAADIGADIPALDPAQWTNAGCSLLLTDGRRLPFHFDDGALSSPSLWAGRPVSLATTWVPSRSGGMVGMINRGRALMGSEEMVVDEPTHRGAKLIQLLDLGDPAAANQRGFAICGYSGLQRRPNLEMDVPLTNTESGRRPPLR